MESKLAETFLKVAEIGNVTRSAEQLGYSQAAVTVQMKQLETQLGVSLFDRIGRGIKLTDAGRAFIPYAQKLVRASNDADNFAMDKEEPSGTITIECSSSLSVGRIPGLIIRFHELYPRVRVVVRTSDNVDSMIEGLRQNLIDFVFETNKLEEYPGCRSVLQIKEKFVFAAHPDDPVSRGGYREISELFDSSFVSSFMVSDRNISYGHSFEQVLAGKGIVIDPMLDFSSTSAIVNVIKRGFGRSLLPEFLIRNELDNGELITIDTDVIDLDIWSQLFFNENRWISPQMQAFIDFMVAEAGKES